jgi:hypothetical protein
MHTRDSIHAIWKSENILHHHARRWFHFPFTRRVIHVFFRDRVATGASRFTTLSTRAR